MLSYPIIRLWRWRRAAEVAKVINVFKHTGIGSVGGNQGDPGRQVRGTLNIIRVARHTGQLDSRGVAVEGDIGHSAEGVGDSDKNPTDRCADGVAGTIGMEVTDGVGKLVRD